ncbi:MAG: hypothetical protein K2X81_25705 [Candidatus Obscuribacterales bacterium]|nr:hypothetical protein [Candidatus Obscuribacterales bacterium]
MQKLTITNKQQLEDWLSHFNWFLIGKILDVSAKPSQLGDKADIVPDTVTFQLEKVAGGSFEAGQILEFDCYEFKTTGVTDLSFRIDQLPTSKASNEAETDEIELGMDEESENLKLFIGDDGSHTDDYITVECSKIEITKLKTAKKIVPPHLSETNVHVEVPNSPLPSACDWLDWFAAEGLDIVIRILGDTGRPCEEVGADYSGWFLQIPSCLAETNGGLMLSGLGNSESGFSVAFTFHKHLGEREAPLWTTLAKVLANRFPDSKVTCGNCKLTAKQWLIALNEGQAYLDSIFITRN